MLPDDRIWVHVDTTLVRSEDKGEPLGDRLYTTTIAVLPPPPTIPPVADRTVAWATNDEGLQQGVVSAFAVDRAGRLYAATNGGLYRFVP